MISHVVRSSRLAPWGALAALCVACQGAPDIESLRTAVVAEVPGAKLTGADLERWLMASPETPTAQTAAILTSTWIDEALLAEAFRKGLPLDAPATIDSLLWTDVTMDALAVYFAKRNAGYPPVTDAQADSLFDAGNVRVFQQLVVNVTPAGNEPARVAAERKANDVRARVETNGEDFTAIVRTTSDEAAAKTSGGIMTAVERDEVPKGPLGGHLWTLRPGDFSRVFSSEESARLFRRVSKTDARAALKAWLAPRFARLRDMALSDSILAAAHLKLADDAIARVRAMVEEPLAIVGTGPMVTWDGGELSPVLVRNWIMTMDPPSRTGMAIAADQDVEQFLKDVAQRDIVMTMSKGMISDSAARAVLHDRYLTILAALRSRVVVNGAMPPADLPTRQMDSLTIALRNYEPVPRGLAGYLRSHLEVKVDTAARRQVVEAVAFRYAEQRADSLRRSTP